MKTITIKGGLYFDAESAKYGTSQIKFFDGRLSKFTDQYIPIVEHTIEATLPPDFDPRTAEVKALEAKRDALHKEFADAVMKIDQRINSLLAIECDGVAS